MLLSKSIPLVSMAVMAIVVGFVAALVPAETLAANLKIGFVSTERIL